MSTATPFNKILIANRGEIVLRVIRTARAMGYRTVAVYSSADADSLHVRAADESVHIGGALPRESYLRIDAIIDAAKKCGADAVHPGYGFLAENAAFARACRNADLRFIGPSPEAIDAMGDKARAKRLMEAAGVPCIPGYSGDDQSDARFVVEAERIGYPVMIKAAAGGGGRGMRLVRAAEEFRGQLASARSEALSAFGNGAMILERAIALVRHIEIQIFADRHGNVVHLGERDCSVQRRHQKLLEESPSPAVSPMLRTRMGEIAVRAAKAIDYEGAGTLEFLLDQAGDFYFMEMNTRLQVEHPVTEAITGLDLVEWQLRVAAGEVLPLRQQEIGFSGHAIEARLCAEDSARDFMPQSGVLSQWRPAVGVRVEHALHSGSQIMPHYDSMLAKIIVHGTDREAARHKLLGALRDTVALGVTTSQAFLANCLSHPTFMAGASTTAFVGENFAALNAIDAELENRATAVAAMLLQVIHRERKQRGCESQLMQKFSIPLRLTISGQLRTAAVTAISRNRFSVIVSEREFDCELLAMGGATARIACNGVAESAVFHRDANRLDFYFAGNSFAVVDLSLAVVVRADENSGDGKISASTNGRVVALLTALDDNVVAGQPVCVIEAMKMEHVHRAGIAGKVMAIHCAVGDQVAARRVIIEVKRHES